MNHFENHRPKLKLFSLRDFLIQMHIDLMCIDAYIIKNADHLHPTLTALEEMVLTLEDRRFFKHYGVDLRSGVREVLRAILRRKHGGASTIDMQFVRTVTGYRQKTMRRKLYEILLATIIQRRYKKIIILRSYLSCAFFGSHLIGGSAAAKKVFQKTEYELNLNESAFIAAMLVYPRPQFPTASWRSRVQLRANYGQRIHITSKDRFY